MTYLLSIDKIDIKDLFDYELAHVPTSLFKDNGEARYPSNKSDLKKDLKFEVSTRNVVYNAIFIDGCAIHWPKGGTVQELLKGIRNYIWKFLSAADVYLVFDRYKEFSIKSDTRAERLGKLRRTYNLAIPSKYITMNTTATKVQLIRVITEYLLNTFYW